MIVFCSRSLIVFLLCFGCVFGLRAQDVQPDQLAPTTSHKTYPQSVRLSLVDGDVRVSRGKPGVKATGEAWEKAEVNLPIEGGFSLVTGNGARVEIEFEDASTMYLGENSVLSFGQLTSKDGVTHSAVELVSGTLSVNVRPTKDSWYRVTTPTDRVDVPYPDFAFLRVNSYLDGMTVTTLDKTKMQLGKAAVDEAAGHTTVFRSGLMQNVAGNRRGPGGLTVWDVWVAERVAARGTAMAEAMKQSGVGAPVAGLADLEGQGHFFDCAPYGRCWEPENGWAQTASAPATVIEAAAVQTGSAQTVNGGALAGQQAQQPLQTRPGTTAQTPYEDDYFPCADRMFPDWWLRNSYTRPGLYPAGYLYGRPWEWAVCHTGSWIHQNRRYVWVAERHRHHHVPVRWVKVNGKTAYVPVHPKDVKGQPPINLKNGLFGVKTEDTDKRSVERIAYNPAAPVKVLTAMPKEFEKPTFAPLRAAEAPKVEARYVSQAFMSGAHMRMAPGPEISFDHKSQSFVVNHQEMQGGKSVSVAQALGGGPAAAHGGGSMGPSHGGGGSSGGSGGGGASHGGGGSSGGGSSGGGGGHSSGGGGGSSSGGGGGGGGASHH
jgi:FecR protein